MPTILVTFYMYSVHICDPTLEKGAYGANYDIEICERKDGKL